jgi:hypothetical protein
MIENRCLLFLLSPGPIYRHNVKIFWSNNYPADSGIHEWWAVTLILSGEHGVMCGDDGNIFPSCLCGSYLGRFISLFGPLVMLKFMTGPLSKQLLLPARLPPLGRGAFMLTFPPSIQFELYGLVNCVILLLGLYYKILGLSPVQVYIW